MESRAHIYVSGLVQGVCFRDFTRSRARSLGLTGWVRNLTDGRVETVAEGHKEIIEALIGSLRLGPSSSRVDDVHVIWERHTGSYRDFQVLLG